MGKNRRKEPKPSVQTTTNATRTVVAEPNFRSHISNNRKELFSCLLFFSVAAIIIHYCYPYADMTSDTGGYIHWGIADKYGGPRPMGYSNFLVFLHHISETTTIVFLAQYIIYCLALLFFYFSCTYLFSITNRHIKYSLLGLLLVSFGGLYTTNLAMSDNLFFSLTVLMITLSLWFVYRPGVPLYIGILVTLVAAISVRYIALVYPLFILIALLTALWKNKPVLTVSIFFMVLSVYGYIEKVRTGTEKEHGTKILTAFGGWQKASNALHIVPYIDRSKTLVEVEPGEQDLAIVDAYVRGTYDLFKHKYPAPGTVGYEFIWIDSLPLRQALYRKAETKVFPRYYNTWNYMGKVFDDYGTRLIKKYPAAFFKYYLLVNLKRTLLPEPEIFEKFMLTGEPGQFEKKWFHVKSKKQMQPSADFLRPILQRLSPMYSVLWALFCINMLLCGFIMAKKLSHHRSLQMSAGYIMMMFVVIFFFATVYAAPTNLRFILPIKPIILGQTALYVQIIFLAIKQGRLSFGKKSQLAPATQPSKGS